MAPPTSGTRLISDASLVRGRHLAPLVLILATLVVFGGVLGHDFVDWDDDLLVWENPDLQALTVGKILALWKALNPLTNTVYALLAQVSPTPPGSAVSDALNPQAFHAANLVFHLLSVLVVFRILHLLIGQRWAACGGALLFGLHPVQVEPVAWVTGLRDVLSGFLALVALWQYILHVRVSTDAPRASRRRLLHYGLATFAFVLALMAKPTAVVVPLMAAVLDRWMLGRTLRESATSLGIWLAAAGAWGILTKSAQPDSVLSFVTPLWARPLVAIDAVGFYLGKLVAPVGLGPDYGRTPGSVIQLGTGRHVLLVASAVTVAVLLARHRRSWLLAAVGLFLAGLTPVLGLVAFLFQLWSTVADRYLYLPLLGVALATAWGLAHAPPRLGAAAAVLVLGLFALRSAGQVTYWRDSYTLFAHALEVNPRSWTAHHNLAFALRRDGRQEEAIEHFTAAVRLKPDLEWAHEFLADELMRAGRTDEAIAHWQQALRERPDFALAHYGLGIALADKGRADETIDHYRQALHLRPGWVEAHYNLANTLAAEGRHEEAIAEYREALRLRPELAQAHSNLGVVLANLGRVGEAIAEYQQALRIDPDLAAAHHNLANALLRSGRNEEAIAHYQAALRAAPEHLAARQGLARALEAAGHP